MFSEENDFIDNDEDVGFSFEALEKLEAEKSTKSLKELDMKLYSDYDPIIPTNDLSDDKSPRYYSAGYDANYECIEDKEILQWKRAFPFIHVVGTGMSLPSNETTPTFDPMPPSVDMNTFKEDGTFVCDETLMVIGKSVILHPPSENCNSSVMNGADDEHDGSFEDIVHGVLEETIAVDQSELPPDSSDSAVDLNDANLCCSPTETQRDEVVSGLFSMIWPEIVDGMKPLIQKVLKLAKDSNMSLDDYRRSNLEDCEVKTIGKKRSAYQDDGADFDFNDDEW